MRKITQQIANAFAQGNKLTIGNTSTEGSEHGFHVKLHGNTIALKNDSGIYMTLAGWNTATTRERLNGIAQVLGLDASFTQRKFEPYFNGKQIGIHQWFKVN
jgi:P pilus assembly chaperone PapD